MGMQARLTKNLATITDSSVTTTGSAEGMIFLYFSFAIAIVARLFT